VRDYSFYDLGRELVTSYEADRAEYRREQGIASEAL
jgi:hypothetical protein